MITIKEIKEKFRNGNIDKANFIDSMHDIHKYLFEYSEIIKDTDVSKIEITDDFVIMTIRSSGIKMICDKNDKRIVPVEILNFNSYEKEELIFINKLIKEGFTVFDIGANIGWYSLNLAKKFNDLKIYSFEPVPKTFDYLNSNLSLNNISDVKTYNIGFSDEEKDLDIYYYPEGSVNASLKDLSGNDSVKKVRCKFIKLDLFVKQNNLKLDFIKCDVEGAELLVFKGAIETLKKDKPIVFTEMLRKWSAKFNYHPNDIINFFSNIGYNCYVIRNNNLEKFEKVDDSTLETNYIFIHKDKK